MECFRATDRERARRKREAGSRQRERAAFGEDRNKKAAQPKPLMMKVYHVKFAYGGTTEPQIRKFIATSAGQAFRKCVREYPGAKLIEAWREGGYTDGYGITSYKPPSVRQLPDQTDQKPREEQMKFDFVPRVEGQTTQQDQAAFCCAS